MKKSFKLSMRGKVIFSTLLMVLPLLISAQNQTISSLPFSATGVSSDGGSNNNNTVCGTIPNNTYYVQANDYTYQYTSPCDQTITVAYSNAGNYNYTNVCLLIKDNGTCIDGVRLQSCSGSCSNTFTINAQAGHVYQFIADGSDQNFPYVFDISVTGTGCAPTCTAPTLQATASSCTGTGNTQTTVNWTRGNGTGGVIVVARLTATTAVDPLSGTAYTANPAFSSGNTTGAGNFVVYNGTGTSVTVTSLTAGSNYTFTVYEYNTTGTCYKTPGSSASATTTGAPPCSSYCTPSYSVACNFFYIDNISVSNLNQAGTGCSSGYVDYTATTVNFSAGLSYPFTISTNSIGSGSFGWWIDFNDDCDFNDAGEFLGNFTASSNSITGNLAIPSGANAGSHRMRVRGGYSGSFGATDACTNFIYGEGHDYTANIAAACTQPTLQANATTCTGTTETSTTVNWTRGNGTAGVIVVARLTATAGAEPASGTSYNANSSFGSGDMTGTGNYVVYKGTGTSVAVTNLTGGAAYTFTVYEYHTTGNCYKTPGSAISVTTVAPPCSSYCTPVHSPACFYDDINNISVSDLNQTGTGCSTGYSNYTTINVNFKQGLSYSFTITTDYTGGSNNFGWWIDFNDDCDFDDTGEFLGNFTATSNPITGNISISYTAPAGKHRMRVSGNMYDAYTASSSCLSTTYGETHDYTAVITPACTQPTVQATATSCTNTGNTQTTVNWTRGNGTAGVIVVARLTEVSEFVPVFGTTYSANPAFGSGSTTGAGNFVVYIGTGTTVTVSNLTQGTSYSFTVYEYNTSELCYKIPGSYVSVTTTGTPPPSCQNAVITTLPFTATGVSNCTGKTRKTACGTSVQETYIYKFTAPESRCYTVSLTGLDQYSYDTYFDISTDCDGAGTCVAKTQGKASLSLSISATAGQSYFISIAGGGSNLCNTFNINVNTCIPGSSCLEAITVSSLPYTKTGVSNCIGDNVGTTSCGAMNGEDIIFKYTPAQSQCISFTASNLEWINNPVLGIFNGCPTSGGSCIKYVTGSGIFSSLSADYLKLSAGNTYYFVVSGGSACDASIDISMTACPPGYSCADPVVITSLPFSKTGVSNCIGDNVGTTSCGAMNGQDIIFKYTPSQNQCVGFSVSNLDWINNPILGIFNGCPNSGGTCIDKITGSGIFYTLSSGYMELINGNTYYFVVSGGTACDEAFDVTLATCPPGRSCADPVVINSLPYTVNNTTNCIGDNISSTVCGSNSSYGQDIIYKYTSPVEQCVSFMLSNFGTVNQVDGLWIGSSTLYEGCPTSGGTCVAKGSTSVGATLKAGTTYYFVISRGDDIISNCDADFNLKVMATAEGGSCCNPKNITIPGTFSNQSTCGIGSFFSSSNLISSNNYPSPYYLDGEDIVYKFTAPTSACYVFDILTTSGDLPGMYLFNKCPETATSVLTFGGSGDWKNKKAYISYPLTAGQTYYLIISSQPMNVNPLGCMNFNLKIYVDPIPCSIPSCPSATMPSDHCSDSPQLDFCSSYCGTTDTKYYDISDIDGNLNNVLLPYGMGIHNNSWIKFTADSTEVEWYYWVDNCNANRGIQFAVLESNDCNAFTEYCVVTEAPAGSGYVYASGLTKGKEYYLMFDGFRTSICDYKIYPHYGLTCKDCPTITVTKNSQTDVKCYGESTGTATVSATGGVSPHTYLWEPLGVFGASQTGLAAGTYKVTAFDKNNCSGFINISITQPTSALTANITGTTPAACGNNNGTATVAASGGTGSYAYLWSSGATQATASGLSGGIYTVTVSDANSCSVTKEAVVSSSGGGVSILSQPSNVTACSDASASFSVSVSGSSPFSYIWSKNGTVINGATNSILNLSSIASGDAGEYKCIISNACGSVPSNIAVLSINKIPVVTFMTPNKMECSTDTCLFKVIATGNLLSYQWKKNNVNISGATGSSYTIGAVSSTDIGTYSCLVSNPCGNSSASTVLTYGSPPLIKNTIPNQSACVGANITFSIEADGSELKYQWTKGSEGDIITGATNSSYTITNIRPSAYDVYSCKVSNSCGTKVLPKFTLTVISPPTSNIVYTKQIKYLHDPITFALSPGGTSPFSFQWIKSGNNIIGATNSVFNINSIECADSGIYSCKISNSCASIEAKITNLYVLNCSRYKFAISGIVKYYNKDSTVMSSRTINTVTNISLLTMGDTLIEKTETDNNGFYIFTDIVNSKYKIVASTSKKWSGSNPADALLVNRNYIGLLPITDPLKRRAADVNNDLKIDPKDALIINRRYIGVINKFVDKNKVTLPDWLFSNPEITIETADVTKNIHAICTGDVNASYSNIPQKNTNTPISTEGLLSIEKGKEFELPVYLNDNVELGAMGLKFQVSSSKFSILSIKSDIQGLIYNIIQSDESDKFQINIAWSAYNQGLNITPDKPLFYIIAKSEEQRAFSFQLSSESVLADMDANYISINKLVVPKLAYGLRPATCDLKVYPNPFSSITNIDYLLPEDANIEINVYNVLGEKIACLADAKQIAGQHSLKFNSSSLREGVYYLRFTIYDLRFNNSVYTKTNILMIVRM